MNTTIETVASADGTPIAVERTGVGAPVILIGGAFNDRSTVAALAGALAPSQRQSPTTGAAGVTADTARVAGAHPARRRGCVRPGLGAAG